ncbi:hypothetical protein T02_2236 [Trichinella nativa]|uniref:Uncharacterized protein n=1 Tax=Trichinella nativa TaxID=6335 RepID=A0A0V1KND9_9BILA|nr:hypothetical protein T02_2236 [Trichinella nativa]
MCNILPDRNRMPWKRVDRKPHSCGIYNLRKSQTTQLRARFDAVCRAKVSPYSETSWVKPDTARYLNGHQSDGFVACSSSISFLNRTVHA